MQQQVWKLQLLITDEQIIKIPKGSRILSVQCQKDILCIWALVYPHMELEEKIIEVFGTGHPMEQDGDNQRSYLGTAQQFNGSLVWHVFERYIFCNSITEMGNAKS